MGCRNHRRVAETPIGRSPDTELHSRAYRKRESLGGTTMKVTLIAAALIGCAAGTAVAQKPSSEFDRGHGQQAWQNSGFAAVAAKCKTPPKPFSIGGGAAASANTAPPP